ncbi:MAG: ECF transporter S component, partial [Ruthenibacterium sp.]
MRKSSPKALDLAQLALFSAIVIVLAFTPFLGYIPLGITKATIIHIPVIIGSILLGPKKGAILGALFGATSLI